MSPESAGVRASAADDDPAATEVVHATAAETAEAAERTQTATARTPRRSLPSVPAPLAIAVAVVALLGVFGTVFFGLKYRHLSGRDHDKTAVTKTSQDFLLALTNFDANNLDADVKHIQSLSTGDFQGQALQFFSSDFRQAAAKVQATSRGQIRDLYVESISGGVASTYADVDQTIANLNFTRPEQDELRIVLTLKKVSGGWLVSDVTVLQAPATPAPTPSTTAAPAAGTPTPTTTAP